MGKKKERINKKKKPQQEIEAHHIRFDWAIKRLLRNKADFKVLEGFLSELLGEDMQVTQLLESEGNQDFATDKYNKVDLLVENQRGELIIIEVQTTSEADYLYRMLYGVSRVITNFIKLGDDYLKVRKIYSINIVYFEIGQGEDYIYHGITEFRGINRRDRLELSERQKCIFGRNTVPAIYPEYYLLKVNNFDNVARSSLEEWIYFFKNSDIPVTFTAKGLPEAREIYHLDNLSESERRQYEHDMEQIRIGKHGIQEGRDDGRWSEKTDTVMRSHRAGLPIATIALISGLSEADVQAIINAAAEPVVKEDEEK
jgi:predicted transposase/invertase (TIGR01784 family)